MAEMFVEVLPLLGLEKLLTYKTSLNLVPGSLVEIPIRHKKCLGVVKNIQVESPDYICQNIERAVYDLPVLTPDLFQLAEWMKRYYGCNWGQVFETFLPAVVRLGKCLKAKYAWRCSSLIPAFRANSFAQKELYDYVQAAGVVLEDVLKEKFENCGRLLKLLEQKSYLERFVSQQEVETQEVKDTALPFELTREQNVAIQSISNCLDKKSASTHLLWGVTGSGKTEVYCQLLKQAHHLGLKSLYLVPEITLTAQALEKLCKRLQSFGVHVVLWHSKLSEKQRAHIWSSILKDEVDVVVGTRSALFAPLKNLGLIIVDEEHEPAYKQSEVPRYHGRDLAVYRSFINNAVCVLGSATPSVETWYNVQKGKYAVHYLKNRPANSQLPKVYLVNMRFEKPNFEGTFVLSNLLKDKIFQCLQKKEQCILFLNRRGYAPYMHCPQCGYRVECIHCHSNLVYHQKENVLRCHLCDYSVPIPSKCPQCGASLQLSRGLGTQRIEACLNQIYPKARVLRLDLDALKTHPHWYEEMQRGDYDIAIGTQMIAKGLDFPKVTLVGLIQADGSLNVDDFRAAERTFQLLVQVSGRAGRSQRPGEVVVQTFTPDAPCIQMGIAADSERFLSYEAQLRKQYAYPPYRHMVRHLLKSRSESLLQYTVERWGSFLKERLPVKDILGPAPALQEKVNNYYRQHLIFLSDHILSDFQAFLNIRNQFPMPKEVLDVWDVDPVDFS